MPYGNLLLSGSVQDVHGWILLRRDRHDLLYRLSRWKVRHDGKKQLHDLFGRHVRAKRYVLDLQHL